MKLKTSKRLWTMHTKSWNTFILIYLIIELCTLFTYACYWIANNSQWYRDLLQWIMDHKLGWILSGKMVEIAIVLAIIYYCTAKFQEQLLLSKELNETKIHSCELLVLRRMSATISCVIMQQLKLYTVTGLTIEPLESWNVYFNSLFDVIWFTFQVDIIVPFSLHTLQ